MAIKKSNKKATPEKTKKAAPKVAKKVVAKAPKKTECCWSHGAPVQSSVAGTLWA